MVVRVTRSPVTTSRPRIASDFSLGSAKRPHTAAICTGSSSMPRTNRTLALASSGLGGSTRRWYRPLEVPGRRYGYPLADTILVCLRSASSTTAIRCRPTGSGRYSKRLTPSKPSCSVSTRPLR